MAAGEGTEGFQVNLNLPVHAALATPSVRGIILNPPPALSPSPHETP